MMLYLLRHAEAEATAAIDALRPLTPKGLAQATGTAKFCEDRALGPQVILTSPVRRAQETAQVIAEVFPKSPMIEVPWAACGMDPEQALQELSAYPSFSSVMLVGHQPDLSVLAAVLLGLNHSEALRVGKSLLMGIDLNGRFQAGSGTLHFFVPAKLM